MKSEVSRKLELWGGFECTFNRVGDRYFDQLARGCVEDRANNAALIAGLGVEAVRFPVLWEKIAPDDVATADWRWPDRELPALRAAGVSVIAGLVHHGSGPSHTNLLDPQFGSKLAAYAGAVAARYPWIDDWTPVNEPLTTARFCGLYGLWYPHRRDDRAFVAALLNQCRAIVLSMQAIRAVNSRARLVQTDDLGKSWGTSAMAHVTGFYNERRWLAWDLLCGRVGPEHPLWRYLNDAGAGADELLWFQENPCPPNIIGVNYYVTSERWLDHRPARFPAHAVGVVDGRQCVDLEAARAMDRPLPGVEPLLMEAWRRYGIPLAITEAHIDAGREDQLRWFRELYGAAASAQKQGADVVAVTAWSIFGAFNWNSLVTRDDGYYESGAFDIRGEKPRPTALAAMLRQVSIGDHAAHPAAAGAGWWRRDVRLAGNLGSTAGEQAWVGEEQDTRPILISGASGTLGRAFARICARRNLRYQLLSRAEMDIADPDAVARAIDKYRPWAIVNASGYVRVDQAEREMERCLRENARGPAVLAAACAAHGIHLTTFSSDMVFDGRRGAGYVESDTVSPINVYGISKARGEEAVLSRLPGALVVRTSAFFGPWDSYNFVSQALRALESGDGFTAPHDLIVTPTYVPDLVDTCLDLAIDGASGVWHLTNGDAVSWIEFARCAAGTAKIDAGTLVGRHSIECGHAAQRPVNSSLGSSRGIYLPSLQHAMDRYVAQRCMV